MTVEEKIERLEDLCKEFEYCGDCPVCSLGYCEEKGWGVMTENQINECYEIAFSRKKEINHPERYTGGKFECIDVMQDVFGADAVKHFCILNAFKYLWRSEKKNGVEDIKKAVWYLNKYIELGGES